MHGLAPKKLLKTCRYRQRGEPYHSKGKFFGRSIMRERRKIVKKGSRSEAAFVQLTGRITWKVLAIHRLVHNDFCREVNRLAAVKLGL